MEEGLVPVCSDLGQSAEHTLLHWMTRRARKGGTLRGVVPLEYERLVDRARRDGNPRAEEALRHLFDASYIEKVDLGESFSFKVLVRCFRSDYLCFSPSAAGARGDSLVPKALDGAEDRSVSPGPELAKGLGRHEGLSGITSVSSIFATRLPKNQERPKKPETRLAQDVFPQVLNAHHFGVMYPQHSWMGLAQGLRRWHDLYDVPYTLVPTLIQEFVQHPDWCRRSKRAPWLVFLSRRQDLLDLVANQQRRDPGRRSFGAQSWNERPTPAPA